MAAKIEKIVLWADVIHSKQVLPDASQLSFNAFAGSQFGGRSPRRNARGRSCCAVKLKFPLEIIGRCNDPGSLGGQDPLKCTTPFLRGYSCKYGPATVRESQAACKRWEDRADRKMRNPR